jgi:hypothetical protein
MDRGIYTGSSIDMNRGVTIANAVMDRGSHMASIMVMDTRIYAASITNMKASMVKVKWSHYAP